MNKKLITAISIALILTVISPFIFKAYVDSKPDQLTQEYSFGAPFPFAKQEKMLPDAPEIYPVILDFESPLETKTNIQAVPFILSFTCFFLLIFSIYSIFGSFVSRMPKKEPR